MSPAFKPVPAGTRFGRLTVVRDRLRGEQHLSCKCDCGGTASVEVSHRLGNTQSCGCLQRERVAERNHRHGMTGTPTHQSWRGMLQRCTNPTHKHYPLYGGRGITVCERWREFVNFYADMGDRPDGMTLDRVDNDGPYAPENCRWATHPEQVRNRPARRLDTECGNGHQYPADCPVNADGSRRCLPCERTRAADTRARKRATV